MKLRLKQKTFFLCKECGHTSPKWLGQCPGCSNWNTFVEEKESKPNERIPGRLTNFSSALTPLQDVTVERDHRYHVGISEFDRILGGGLNPGSVVLLGGPPGIGKSTLMLQVASELSTNNPVSVLYVSGEESLSQVRSRADRLDIKGNNLFLLSETNLEVIFEAVNKKKPDILIIDSIQTVYKPEIGGMPGAVSQIRECAAELTNLAKGTGTSVFILGHVTKEGDLAGPRLLEHIVDTVLYFEVEKQQVYRILRAFKNRFGPTSEIGVFEMQGNGLREVENPSDIFLGDRRENSAGGSAVVSVMEGTRPIFVEVQALVTRTLFGMPRRQVSGMDFNKAVLLIAVLEKRCGLHLESHDVYINVAGGMRVREPDVDLGVALAVASAYSDTPLAPGTVFIGEVGLGGEVRRVAHLSERLSEAHKLGFKEAVIPGAGTASDIGTGSGISVKSAGALNEALDFVLKRRSKKAD